MDRRTGIACAAEKILKLMRCIRNVFLMRD
jgi:hypothetical protein